MVNEQEQDSDRKPANQRVRDVVSEPNKINASTPYDFSGKNLTPYGGLLPVITMVVGRDGWMDPCLGIPKVSGTVEVP